MKQSNYSESQIVFAIKQVDTRTRIQEVFRKMGISEATFYNWKKKITILKLFLLIFSQSSFAQQTILTDSNLPIMVITTDVAIPDEPKVPATMKLIFRPDGTRNYLTDINTTAFLNYDGDIGIELRGSSSQSNLLDKKPYGFTTLLEDGISNNNVSLLGMPSENDWVLNSLAFDASMIRDYLSYTLASNMGNYAPRVKYIEVIVNEDYKGVYILTEKIKIDSDRVDLTKLSDSDNSSPEVTGGYIIKADKTTGGDAVAWSMPGYNYETNFLHDKPKTEDITSQQVNYIEDVFNDLAAETNPPNTSILNGYPSIIDIPSFVDYIIMAEITSNVDSYQYSTFFHKDRGGKLRAGPVWDYNLTYGNDLFWWGYDRSLFDVWQFDLDNTGAKFWKDLSQDATFKCYLAKRWFELTDENQALNYNTIENQIDEYVALLSESKEREQERWRTVSDHLTNIAAMKVWIQNRINWISDNIGSTNNCLNVTVPNLVISKIHYNPLEDGEYSSKNLEYIEITNNTDQSVDLTGYYIRELGISYQFPANTSVTANQRIYLCSNTTAFENYYGISPFGQFTRNLSNSSYKIILSDAFGNTIDEVTYQDDTPWPENADGSGSYLELIDLNSDNSLASNWRDSTAPQLNITVDDSNPDEFEVSFTFDKAVTNFDVSDIELDNANIVSFAANFNGLEYTLKITPQTTTTSPCITISVADGAANMPGGASLAFVNIPDTNFKTALLASTSIDTNEDNLISCSEAAAYTGTISVGDKNIGSLAGIEAFVNITGLNCSRNTLTSLDLSYNTALKTLECYTNSLESLKVSNSTAITYLNCAENSLTSLDVSNSTVLEILHFENNDLTRLNVANGHNENITYFNASNNPDLNCIQVDDISHTTGWSKDASAIFSTVECCTVEAIAEDIVVNLDVDGKVTITPEQVNSGSSATCASSIVLSLSKTDFTWVNIGDNQVTLYVTATVDGQDFTDSVTVKVTVQDAITHVSPNPVTNTLNIITTSDVQLKNAKIYSMSGEELLTDVSNQIDVSSLSSGMYILKIESVDGQIQMIKILKK